MYEKPPIGVRPRAIHDQGRLSDIFEAVLRYMTAGCKIPPEWAEEANEIISRYNATFGEKE